jgi:hypothetical protein
MKLIYLKSAVFFLLVFAFSEIHAAVESDVLCNLMPLCQELSLSNYSAEEREYNLNLSETVYSAIKLLSCDIDKYPAYLNTFLHLSYKLANCFQQNDRAAEGEIVLSIAFQVLERRFPQLAALPSEDACELLLREHPLLPALYAALLHYSSKSYFYRQFFSPLREHQALNQIEKNLKRALEIRIFIDRSSGICEEPEDSGKGTYCRHTILFYRTLGYLFLEKGDLASAEEVYKNILQTAANRFEEIKARQKLIKIYVQLARQEWDPQQASLFYYQAYENVQCLQKFLNDQDYSGLPTDALVFAEFYSDRGNPYYDLYEAKSLLEKVVNNKRTFSQQRMAPAIDELKSLYEQLSQKLLQQSAQLKSELEETYFAGKVSPLLKSDPAERLENLIALASHYCMQKQFLQAGLLLSNALSQADHIDGELQEKLWYHLFLIEKECRNAIDGTVVRSNTPFTFAIYQANLRRYKKALQEARHCFQKTLTFDTCWQAHRELSEEIQHILQNMLKEIYTFIQPVTKPFVVMAMGSLAREMPSPYSDVEFVLAYSESSSDQEKERFACMSTLFLLKMIALGETPVTMFKWPKPPSLDMSGLESSEGLRPDSGGVISHSFGGSYCLCGTISELLAFSSDLVLPMEFYKGKLLFGSPALLESLQERAHQRLLEASTEEKKVLVCKDLISHTVPRLRVNAQGERCYSLKHIFLRGTTLLLGHAANYFSIKDSNLEKILLKLEENGALSTVSKNKIDTLLRQLLCMRGFHCLECAAQLQDIVLAEDHLEDFLSLVVQYQEVIEELTACLPYYSKEGKHPDQMHIRLRMLCRGGYIDLAQQRIEKQLSDPKNQDPLWEIRGDLAGMQSKPQEAYAYYKKALDEDSKNFLMHFKLAEAAIQNQALDLAKKHLQQLEGRSGTSGNQEAIGTKLMYLKSLIARHENRGEDVQKLLLSTGCETVPILKQESLIHALLELEKGRLYRHLGNQEKARQHVKLAKDLIVRRYGPLHPVSLSTYEELLELLKPEELLEKKAYSEKVASIKQLFPTISSMGVLDVYLLD